MPTTYDLGAKNPAPKTIISVAALVLLFGFALSSFEVVGAGERGVIFSQISGIKDVQLGEGLHFKIPFVEDIISIDVKVQKSQTEATASSRDLQSISSTIALNFHIDPDKAHKVYQGIGTSYKERIIDPAVQEAVKAVAAHYTAEELIAKRAEVKDRITMGLTQRLGKFNILVDEFSIVNFAFSEQFNIAIEAKQGAEQAALKATRDLERIKVEAEQQIVQAKAESEAMRLRQVSLTPMLLQLRALEKWDGKLPTVSSGAVPFINLDNFSK